MEVPTSHDREHDVQSELVTSHRLLVVAVTSRLPWRFCDDVTLPELPSVANAASIFYQPIQIIFIAYCTKLHRLIGKLLLNLTCIQ